MRPTTRRTKLLRPLLLLGFILAASVSTLYGSQAPDRATLARLAQGEEGAEHAHGRGGHDGSEGVLLGGQEGESAYAGARCPQQARRRAYSVVAINVEISLNRYLDYDPQGRMYVLEEELERVRREEEQNRTARQVGSEPAVTIGLQGDAIQPLILRANQGECVRITLRNDLTNGESASLHVHGAGLYVLRTGAAAVATNPDSIARPGDRVNYEWWIPEDEPEATHYFHSHGNDRQQSGHGLFGALIVEPAGSRYLDPLSGQPLRSGWSAIIAGPSQPAFREFAFVYHEIGNENYSHLNKAGRPVEVVDELTTAYKPGGRAVNYRSEPFQNRLQLQLDTGGALDASLAYSSYVFGDPATPIARSYLGDRVKQRVIHGGSEVFHVHHVHGGAIRWIRQPKAETHVHATGTGLHKHPPLTPEASERVDSQGVGPSEEYDLENECGSGGCQQSAGDYLIHCHVAHHYFSGMWFIWRVYNTLQDGVVSQDQLPALQELPDRPGAVVPAVTSRELSGTTVDWAGQKFSIDAAGLAEWVERQLPPRGVPQQYDASVYNWERQGDLYLGEPLSDRSWPGYRATGGGTRPPIYFDPRTGKLAYPMLRPHLGQRPPFAPNHGPAPFLEPIHDGTDPAEPGQNGPWSLCPAGTQRKELAMHAITLPIPINQQDNLVDPDGTIFVLKQEEEQVRADNGRKIPLAIRANAGEDCVDIVFKSELVDNRDNHFLSKVNVHIHFVQFDVQASDGVETGFNYEQGVRPFTVEGQQIARAAQAGATTVELDSTARFQPGVVVGVGMDQDETFEIRRIKEIDGNTLIFDEPLEHQHAAQEIVSTEFVRYRWYPDVQFGTAYFHDHVNALVSWRHGLYGALVSEPPGSTYHHPHTGAELLSGPVADIHTDQRVSADVAGSFRELVLLLQDDNILTNLARTTGSSLNLRAEPLAARPGPPEKIFSSAPHGDPETPLLESYLGDPVVLRSLVAATNDVHTIHVDGHWFRYEPYSLTSAPISTAHLGISERLDLSIPRAGGPQQMPGDYLYYNGRASKLEEGSWGLFRVYDEEGGGTLRKLPGHEQIPAAASEVCPPAAPRKSFAIAAVEAPLPMLGGQRGLLYVLQEDKAALQSGAREAEPLVLHVNVGDCLSVELSNETGGAVTFHADMLAADPQTSQGVEAGRNAEQAVKAGQRHTYTFYAHPEVGETVALVRDWGDVLRNPQRGLYGAIVVGAAGSRYTDPATGADLGLKSAWAVDVHPPQGPSYRDFALLLQDQDQAIGTAIMPYTEQVEGVAAINYRTEPLGPRLAENPSAGDVFRTPAHGLPATPLLRAFAGDPLRIHVLAPYSEQSQVFSLEGHQWPFEPGRQGSDLLSSVQLGALEAITIVPQGGAGGRARLPGAYLYGNHREPYREAGMWGLMYVYARGAAEAGILPLP